MRDRSETFWLKRYLRKSQRHSTVRRIHRLIPAFIRRLFSALSMIAQIDNYQIQDKLDELEICITKKVSVEIANIMNEFGIEIRRYAYELADMNISTKKELEKNEDYVMSFGTDGLKNYLMKKGYLTRSKIQAWRKELNE